MELVVGLPKSTNEKFSSYYNRRSPVLKMGKTDFCGQKLTNSLKAPWQTCVTTIKSSPIFAHSVANHNEEGLFFSS